jgi:hypothetical protein
MDPTPMPAAPSAQPAPIRVERYDGADQEGALRWFAEDAQRAAASGYEVLSQVWEGKTLLVTYRYVGVGRATPRTASELSIPAAGVVSGAALIVLGSLLPWATAVGGFGISVSKSGVEGDGVFTIILGIAIGLVGLTMLQGQNLARARATLIASAIALALIVFEFIDIQARVKDLNEDSTVYASIGMGVWVVGIGALVATFASWRALSARRTQ